MANGQPRSELRRGWGVPEHLSSLDDDVDKIVESMNDGFKTIAAQLERNRKTWQFFITTMLAVGMFVVAVVALLNQ